MLLIHDHQPEVAERKKKRGSYSENKPVTGFGIVVGNPFPYLNFLLLTEPGMIYPCNLSKMFLQPSYYLGCKSNFGQHVENLFTKLKLFLNQTNIDFSFPA